MGVLVYSAELLEGGMRVHLRRRRAGVTQQSPDTFDTCAIVEHRRGKGMPQHVRRELLLRTDERKLILHQRPYLFRSHPLAF